jgi:hypothetical protein
MNTDLAHNNCAASEQKLNIPVGTLQKSTKTDAEKKADLVEVRLSISQALALSSYNQLYSSKWKSNRKSLRN